MFSNKKMGPKKESSHDLIFINNEPHSMFILTYIENKLFLYVCQFPIFRNLDVYVFKLSESEVSECIMGNCCQVVKF